MWKRQVAETCKYFSEPPPSLICSKSELKEILKRKNWRKFVDANFPNQNKQIKIQIRNQMRKALSDLSEIKGSYLSITVDDVTFDMISINNRVFGKPIFPITLKHEVAHLIIERQKLLSGKKVKVLEAKVSELEKLPIEQWDGFFEKK